MKNECFKYIGTGVHPLPVAPQKPTQKETESLDKTPSATKKHQNSSNYSQVKMSVKPDIAIVIKNTYTVNNASITAVIFRFIAKYSGTESNRGNYTPVVSTMKQRKTAPTSVINRLRQTSDSEERCPNNITISLRGSKAFQSAERCISNIEGLLGLPAFATSTINSNLNLQYALST